MRVPFESLAPESRIWVYTSGRILTVQEEEIIQGEMDSFCDQWSAHGNPLKCSFRIDHHYFLILSVDEASSGASGCSIDGSVRILKSLGERLGLDFFDRLSAAFQMGESVTTLSLKNIKSALAQGIITAGTPAFNTLAATKKELEQTWIVPLEQTWLAKYLPKTTVA